MMVAKIAVKLALVIVFVALSASAQSNQVVATNREDPHEQTIAWALKVEEIRTNCIQNRRRICGKILKVLPEGLVIDSGYTNLARTQINRSWLIPGTVAAERATNVIEEVHPGAFCIGLVFLTDLPKSPGAKPKLYDYVNLEAFPAGHYTYVSVGDLHRTVRKFSTKLPMAVQYALDHDPLNARPSSNNSAHP
ncbi:MAG TPA: hypothetical protein VG754_13050 [Verrucomicrobiae bacterium]|nr:hypothetical protein [Verrucomicrobiae bacterium]